MLYVVIILLALTSVGVAVGLLRRKSVLHEVDRFHVARSLTTTWASEPQPDFAIPAPGDESAL